MKSPGRAAALPAWRFDEPALSPGCEILLLEDDAPLRKRLAAYLHQLGATLVLDSTGPNGPTFRLALLPRGDLKHTSTTLLDAPLDWLILWVGAPRPHQT